VGRAALIATVLTLAACEHGIDLTGQVSVPASVQRMFSADRPGELIVRVKAPEKTFAWTALDELLCAPGDADKAFPIRQFWFGCAVPEVVMVSAVVVPRDNGDLACGVANLRPWHEPPPDPQIVVASGTASAPMQVAWDWMACKNGSASFALRLAPRGDQISAGAPAR
jgi:hypothetical protein